MESSALAVVFQFWSAHALVSFTASAFGGCLLARLAASHSFMHGGSYLGTAGVALNKLRFHMESSALGYPFVISRIRSCIYFRGSYLG